MVLQSREGLSAVFLSHRTPLTLAVAKQYWRTYYKQAAFASASHVTSRYTTQLQLHTKTLIDVSACNMFVLVALRQ